MTEIRTVGIHYQGVFTTVHCLGTYGGPLIPQWAAVDGIKVELTADMFSMAMHKANYDRKQTTAIRRGRKAE